MKRFKFTLVGVGRILMHNGRLADPSNEYSKAIKAATKSSTDATEETTLELLRAKFLGGLYHTPEMGLCFPGDGILSACVKAANNEKPRGLGKKIKSAVDLPEDVEMFPFRFKGYAKDRDTPERLYEQGHRLVKGVRIGKSRVIGCRPCFSNWMIEGELQYDPKVIDLSTLVKVLRAAGASEGVGDWRPRFGRFNVETNENTGASNLAKQSDKKKTKKEAA